VQELENQKKIVVEVANEVLGKAGSKLKYMSGTMIEIPRAELTAELVAKEASSQLRDNDSRRLPWDFRATITRSSDRITRSQDFQERSVACSIGRRW